MLQVTVKDLTSGKVERFFDEESAVMARLRHERPEAQSYFNLADVIQAINDFGQCEVLAVPYAPQPTQLPPNYLTHQERDPKEDR